jgi:hypothetical protein
MSALVFMAGRGVVEGEQRWTMVVVVFVGRESENKQVVTG